MRICVLFSSNEHSSASYAAHDFPFDPAFYNKSHEFETFGIHKLTAVKEVTALVKSGKYDLFFNLCDGAWDEDRAGEEVVRTLERLEVPFVGASSEFYEPSKETMKKICHYYGINTPRFLFCYNEVDINAAAANLRFPLFVKHYNGGNSVGLTPDCKVINEEGLRKEAQRFIAEYGGALVEEYVPGDEYSVLVVQESCTASAKYEGRALTPVRVCFPEGEEFKHFSLKWVDFEGLAVAPVEDSVLAEKLQTMSVDMFRGCRGTSFARCDLRVHAETGEVYMLEINPNCSIFYRPGQWGTADEIMHLHHKHTNAQGDFGQTEIVDLLISTALQRHKLLTLPFEVVCAPGDLAFGMRARRPISEGEIIDRHEAEPQYLVTKAYVDRSFSPLEKQWFAQNAHPASGSGRLYYIWSPRPEDWHPINHSCDPNSQLEGLDLVARRAIPSKEAITMDYSTFCDETMMSFDCQCGSEACRGRVTGEDWRRPELQERFAGRFSDALQSRIDSNKSVNKKFCF